MSDKEKVFKEGEAYIARREVRKFLLENLDDILSGLRDNIREESDEKYLTCYQLVGIESRLRSLEVGQRADQTIKMSHDYQNTDPVLEEHLKAMDHDPALTLEDKGGSAGIIVNALFVFFFGAAVGWLVTFLYMVSR